MWQQALDRLAKFFCLLRYRNRLSAFLDNELDVPSAKAIAEHLSACVHCRVEVEQLRFASRALVELELLRARRSPMRGQVFRLTALKEVSLLKRFHSQKIGVPLPLAAGLSIVFVSVILLAIFRNPRPSTQSGAPLPAPSVVIKVVEVPVDRVVTRTVYLKQPRSSTVRGTREEDRFTTTNFEHQRNIAQNNPLGQWSNSTLKEFRPAASANFRVIREPER